MTPQERELIEGLFQRLKAADTPQKDREAEDLINKRTVEAPATPYLLVQTTLVQEHALSAAQERIAQLEKELEQHKAQAPAAAAGSTSFLGGLLGGGRWNQGAAAAAASGAAPAPRSSVPITAPAAPAAAGTASPYAATPAAPASGGFLHSALTTAAGVAGGALLYDGLSSLLFHRPGPFAPYLGASGGGLGGSPWGSGGNVYETNVYNYGDSGQPNDQNANAIDTSANDPGANDPDVQDASYDPSDDSSNVDDNSGGDFGGGNDDMSV